MNTTKQKLNAILNRYVKQVPETVAASLLASLRSPAPFLARVRYLVLKGQIQPEASLCLPPSE